jgi:hypothetical protein
MAVQLTHVRRWSGGQSLRHQHALGVFSARPTEVATAATGAGSGALWLVETSRSGLAVVEAYAVMRGRHGDPVRKFAAYRPPRGTRVLASVDSADLSASVRRRGSLWPPARRGRVHGSRESTEGSRKQFLSRAGHGELLLVHRLRRWSGY